MYREQIEETLRARRTYCQIYSGDLPYLICNESEERFNSSNHKPKHITDFSFFPIFGKFYGKADDREWQEIQ